MQERNGYSSFDPKNQTTQQLLWELQDEHTQLLWEFEELTRRFKTDMTGRTNIIEQLSNQLSS